MIRWALVVAACAIAAVALIPTTDPSPTLQARRHPTTTSTFDPRGQLLAGASWERPPTTVPSSTTTAPPTSTIPPARADRLRSTSYCLTGGMASGRRTYVGAVAANRYKLGTRLTANPNPWGDPGMVFTVEDRHADGATQLDFAMPGECRRALAWGNTRYVVVTLLD